MSDVRLSVGTTVFARVGAPANYTEAGFSILEYTEIGEVTNIGEFGGTAQITQHVPIKTGIVSKRKGSIDYGTAALQIGRLSGDAGQALLKAGFDGANAYSVHSFKVVSEDGQTAYFTGLVGSFTTVYNDANAVTAVNCNIELDNRVIAASADFTLQYAAGANGSIIGPAFQSVSNGGNGAPVYANPDPGYVFDEWSDESDDNPRQDTNVDGNVSVTASFIPE